MQPPSPIAKGGVACPFPWKLHEMLDATEREGLADVVSWQPHGRAFKVHKPKIFVDKVLTRFFGQSKYPSFQRQLNLYGFNRFAHGTDKNAYYHSCFIRGEPQLVTGMVRRKIKGNKVRRALSPAEEPDFYAMDSLPVKNKSSEASNAAASTVISDEDDSASHASMDTIESLLFGETEPLPIKSNVDLFDIDPDFLDPFMAEPVLSDLALFQQQLQQRIQLLS